MTSSVVVSVADLPESAPSLQTGGQIRFPADDGFYAVLRQRVAEHFRTTGADQTRGNYAMWLKSALILAVFAGSYVLLVFVVTSALHAVLLTILLGVIAALVGFNIQHDGGHQAYSAAPWRNRLAAATLDLIGASSYLWHWKHAVFHHGFSNIAGQDTDISVGRVLRLEPQQAHLPHHRWQHLYIWPLYGLMAVRWQLYDDFREVVNGAIGPHRIPRPRGRELVIFAIGKLLFIGLALILPMLFHPVWVVVLLYTLSSYTLSLVLSIVFQLAHNTALCEFPLPPESTGRMAHSWAVHQVLTTADFSRRSRIVTWLCGGLNFQIEHHLFPQVCHVHYPALSPIVEATCREHGIAYREHPSFLSGLRAHFRWLRVMGQPAAVDATT